MIERNAPVLERTLEQDEIDALFRDITDLIDLSSLDDLDLQADAIDELEEKRDQLHAKVMERPADAFGVYFTILKRLYEGRTLTETDSLGTVMNQFVTRNPERTKADLHFRELSYGSGSVEQVVEVPREDGLPFYISLKDDQLRMAATTYRRGMYRRVELDPTSDRGEQLLEEFFMHYTDARDQLKTRSTSELVQADSQATRFLVSKIARERTL